MKRSELEATGFVAFVLCMAVLVWVMSQRPSPSGSNPDAGGQQQSYANTAQPQQRGTPDAPFVISVLDGNSAQIRAAKGKYWSDEKPSDWWMIGLTFALAIIAGVQAVLFVSQLSLMKVTLKHTADNAKGAVDAAAATKEAVETAKDSTERQLRAYVSFSISRLDQLRPTVNYTLVPIHHGQTPALKLAFRSRTLCLPVDDTVAGKILAPDGKWDEDRLTLFPNEGPGELPVHTKVPISDEQAKQMEDGTHYLVTYMQVRYEDVFGHIHRTEAALLFRNDGRIGVVPGTSSMS